MILNSQAQANICRKILLLTTAYTVAEFRMNPASVVQKHERASVMERQSEADDQG